MTVAEAVARPLVARFDPRADTDYAAISVREFQAMILETKGSTVVTLTALTVPDYRKTGCPFKNNIQKLARVNGFLNWVYEDAVNRQRVRENKPANFEAEPRAWGTQLKQTCFISHVTRAGDHKLYLKFKVQTVLNIAYLTLDGQDIPETEVEPWLNEKERNYRQGLQREVVERDYTVANLLAVVYNRMGYIIIP